SRACFGRRSPAPFAFDWRTSRRGAIRFTRQPENARSNGAPLHRQSRCALGNVRRGIYNSETAGRPHFRSCPSVAGKPGEVAREIFTQSATERRKAALGDILSDRVAHASRVLVSASRRNSLWGVMHPLKIFLRSEKSAMARTPLPARETRALPDPSPRLREISFVD